MPPQPIQSNARGNACSTGRSQIRQGDRSEADDARRAPEAKAGEDVGKTILCARAPGLAESGRCIPDVVGGRAAQRLDGRSKTLLAASIKALPYETPGWITNKEARQLFSSRDDDYAFGEMGEVGKSNIADFAAHVTPRCSFEFMPVGLVYFIRRTDGGRDRD